MLRYRKPPRRSQKPAPKAPLTKAVAQQRRAEALNRYARMVFTVFYGLAGAVIVFNAAAKTTMSGPAPQVGDVLPITAAAAQGESMAVVPARLLTGPGPWAPPGQGCWLDEAVMSKAGGTLTVLAVRPDGVMLSWVGGDTARVASCPAPGQILVSAANYAALAQIIEPDRPRSTR